MSKKITLKLDEMIEAMENHNNYIKHYIDLETGEIIFTADDYFIEDIENENEIMINEEPERYCFIDPVDSDEAFKIMENFVHDISDKQIQDSFYKSIYRSKPFRHFKDTLSEHPELQSKYHDYHREHMNLLIEEWLEDKSISADLI
ncbi:MAG: hypothetical protein JW982_10380 [Spirochaetes bacterium]|nr:hypothetical protein [Spirochaetota bacterium]